MKKRNHLFRYISLATIFILVCFVYIARLISIQITGQDYYTTVSASTADTHTRTVKIQAHRGEVFDRNGVPLITNSYSYNMIFDKGSVGTKNSDINDMIIQTIECIDEKGISDKLVTQTILFEGQYPNYSFNYELIDNSPSKYRKYLEKYGLEENLTCEELSKKMLYRYGITDSKGELLYDESLVDKLLTFRFDMDYMGFDVNNPYTVVEGVDIEFITLVKENSIKGTDFVSTVTRVYNQPGVASHILGRVGKIQSNKVEYYNELGYPLDAIVGIGGVEEAFEQYLHGEDGELVIVEDSYGNVIDSYVSVEPVDGKNVYLTIDIEMQKVAEQALKENIEYIAEKGEASGKKLNGEDARTGALTVIKPDTGEVLALASYPTYNLVTFNEDYSKLNEDPLTPMLNRALQGIYPPGSTFKVATAAAALTEGIITPDTIIEDKGIYTYYKGYQPRCWIYLKSFQTHGKINVTKAIQVSCNYFFFEVGRQLTIETLNEYCKKLGLGQPTGIELGESVGILAGPEYRDSVGREAWGAEDTLQAAIGQSDNAFTPLQISVYMGSLVNNGVRMKSHILKSVNEFYSDKELFSYTPEVVDSIELSPEHHTVLMNAMKSVTEDDGSAVRVFSSYPINVGGKTGTAQTFATQSDNAVFTAFAPFEAPEIVATCVIEKGANGTDAGYAVRDIFSYYFGIDY